jgi:acylphosphatase
MIVARRYVVSGRVQGVGFRFFTQDVARREGLQGYVRNLTDGRVETLATGDAEAVDRFERAIRQGPPHADVEQMTIEDHPANLSLMGFEIQG